MIRVLCVRRFNQKEHGVARNVEAARVLDLPMAPAQQTLVAFADGGRASVLSVLLHATPRAAQPTVEVRMATEPGPQLSAALAAGWAPLGAPE
jgi:hypothetical protein